MTNEIKVIELKVGGRKRMGKTRGKKKELDIFNQNIAPVQKVCKVCGRKRIVKKGKDRIICDWCGHYVYKDEGTEFRYKMQEALKK